MKNMKKALGITLLIAAIALGLLTVVSLPGLLQSFKNIGLYIMGDLESDEGMKAIGWFLYWIIHIAITVFLWKKGIKMREKKV